MADLAPYERTFSFAGFQANQPRNPVPGLQIDRELDDIAARMLTFGKSAFEIAQLEGFVGTRGEWLLSLVGPRGPIGPRGIPGSPGATTFAALTDVTNAFSGLNVGSVAGQRTALGLGGLAVKDAAAISDVTGLASGLADKLSLTTGGIVNPTTITATDGANVNVIRQANYSGGTPGYTNVGLRAYTTVAQGVTAFEWNMLCHLDNHADAGENCGIYITTRKFGKGGSWAACIEATEPTGTPYGAQFIGLENVMTCAGGDTSDNRIVHYAGFKAQPDSPSGQMDGYAVYCARGEYTARAKYVFTSEHQWREAMFFAQTKVGVGSPVGSIVRWLNWGTTTANDDRAYLQHKRISDGGNGWDTADLELARYVDGSEFGALVLGGNTGGTAGVGLRVNGRSMFLTRAGAFQPSANNAIALGASALRFSDVYANAVNIQSAAAPTGRSDTSGEVGELRYTSTDKVFLKRPDGWSTIATTPMS